MKSILIICFFGLCLPAIAQESHCIVISGLERDGNNAFWDFKEQNIYQGCSVFKSIKEYAQTAPKNKVIDLRVISHGKKDGTLQCDAGDESPSEVINTLNSISEKNKVFISLDSCYSEQVLKEKILADHKNLSSKKAQNNLCLYASSAPLRETFVDQISFADLHFKSKQSPKNISVLELYNQTAVGLMSAAPYDESGVTSFWANEDVKAALTPFLETLEKMMSPDFLLPQGKCETLVLATKLNPIHFAEISQSLLAMSRAEDMFDYSASTWKELILSFNRLLQQDGTKEYFQTWLKEGYDFARFRDVDKLCKEHAPQEAFCQHAMKGLNNYSIGYIFEHRKMVNLLGNVTEKRILLDEMITTKDILERFTKEVAKGKTQMTEDSFRAIMGMPSTNPALEFGLSGPENEKVNWSGYLGAFNRLSLAPKNIETWSKQKDKIRYNACKQFYYDGEGKLRTTR